MRTRLILIPTAGAALCLAVGAAVTVASRSDDAAAPAGESSIRVQGKAVADPVEQMAKARGLRLERGASIASRVGAVSASELQAVGQNGEVSPRSACKTVALAGGGGNTACKRVNERGVLGEPLVSVTVLGGERYAVTALLPPGAGNVRLGARASGAQQELGLSRRMFGLQADYGDIGTLRYAVPGGEERRIDLRQLAEDAATG